MLKDAYTFSVFTPTYNRAHLLHRVYESLTAQTFKDFEWLVVDDGSSDCTPELVQKWKQAAAFPIRYIYQNNAGKHTATNRGAQAAAGELFFFLDSDDSILPNALERYMFHWDSIPAEIKGRFSAVSALVQDPDGRIVGSRFPYNPTDSDSLEIRYKYKVAGEKRGFHRTAVLRQYPYPQYEHENVLPDSWLWNQIALKYKTRYVNEALTVYYPNPDGLSAKRFISRALNPQGARRYYLDLVKLTYPFPHAALLKGYANYVRFSLHARIGLREQLRQAPSALFWLIAWPLGTAGFLRDRQAIKTVSARISKT